MAFRGGRLILGGLSLSAIATWAACMAPASLIQTTRTPPRPAPPPAVHAPPPVAEYEEGLLVLDMPRPGEEVAAPPRAVVPAPTSAARQGATEALSRARTSLTGRTPAAAATDLARAATLVPLLADWSELLTTRIHVATRDSAEVRRRYEALLETDVAEWAWRPYFDVLRTAGDTTRALSVAEAAARRAETSAERALAWARVGVLRVGRRDSRAIESLREAMRANPGSEGGLAAARLAHDLSGLTPDDRLLIGRTLLTHGGTDRGIPMLEAYTRAPATTPAERAVVNLEIGRLHFNARRYDPAIEKLRAAAEHEAEAAFLLGRSLYRNGRQDQGMQTFADVGRRYGASPFAADALFLLGDLAHDAGQTRAAAEHYRQAVATGAHNVSATDAVVRLAGISLLAGDRAQARRDLDAYFAARPRDRVSAPAIYWLGRTLLDSGETARARESFAEVLRLDPFSYYGMLAAERLGTSLREIPLPAPPAGPIAPEIQSRLLIIEILRDAGFTEESDLELARLREVVDPGSPALYEVAEALARAGQPVAAALLARDIQRARDVWDDRLLRIVYLFPHRDIVVAESRRNGLDPFAVAGLIRQESFFNPVAVSPAGAIGLMQVMPETGAGLARRAGIAGFQSSRLRDPQINVRLGTLYLADQMRRWDDRFSDVLGAYNAGPNRVVRWRTFPEHRDEEIYVERIPIAETRDYVKRVRLNGEIYRRLYAGEL